MQEFVELWRRMPGCERLDDSSWYQGSLEVTFWCDEDGFLHRDSDLPAVVHDDGLQEWHRHGVLHRDGAPALVAPMPSRIAYATPNDNGAANAGDDMRAVRRLRPRSWSMPATAHGQLVEAWYTDGVLTREDGPAMTWADGAQEFWVDGRLHRDGGPAVQYPQPYGGYDEGPDEYWVQGRLHRTDGPARTAFRSSKDPALGHGEYFFDGRRAGAHWPVLRHHCADSPRGHISPDNADLWDALEAAGAIDHKHETVDPDALAVMARLYPN
ncbi:hypothetical protein [Demequina flava]|uniref:hypothetical protein n=1 Tax=Demequina flava TaxID=1095025 RepID=UPI000784DB39|nr:hypothetical protein [Demequina flava]